LIDHLRESNNWLVKKKVSKSHRKLCREITAYRVEVPFIPGDCELMGLFLKVVKALLIVLLSYFMEMCL